ncbi:MAG: arginine--tRNA ligase [Flavobacteriaceae bacterium]|nr:arginine--tRNA ligase [Flavobacteriaceae bacterium]
MGKLINKLTQSLNYFLESEYNLTFKSFEFQATRKEFEGDLTLVVFPLVNLVKVNPNTLSNEIGKFLLNSSGCVSNFNVIKGFLNLTILDEYYLESLNEIISNKNFGFIKKSKTSNTVLVEYSSPNTNKPLHLGHIRNNLLGFSISKILEANGNKVIKTQIINDRGIHICKSMLAWKLYGNGVTPKQSGIKGDLLVGNFYILFEKHYKSEIKFLVKKGMEEEEARLNAPIFKKAQEMLINWESGDKETIALWKKMNSWVYKGFESTYNKLGVSFDSYYYESETYLLGKGIINEGLEKKVFFKKPDGSVWVDLSDEGLDEKLLIRADGTSVYITQDIGTAVQRYKDNESINSMIYTVGNEQDYHFNVLFLILKKIGYDWAKSLYHLSYGMVDLPEGKMKSREGNVIDADDLIIEMINNAKDISKKHGKLDSLKNSEKNELYKKIGLGALKYYILKVDPKKRILFDSKSSIDFSGNTGSFIQYTYARIKSIIRKSKVKYKKVSLTIKLHIKEKELIKHLQTFPEILKQSALNYSPALIANYLYELVKLFNSFYQNINILSEEKIELKIFKIHLAKIVGENIKSSCSLLGIDVPEKM